MKFLFVSFAAIFVVLCVTAYSAKLPNLVDVQTEIPRKIPKLRGDTFDDILKINARDIKDLYQGDIMKSPSTYNAVQNKDDRWPCTIPYEIHTQFSSEQTNLIISVLHELQVRTCLNFVPRTTEPDYLFFEILSGCWSSVGRTGGKQVVSIGVGCAGHRTILHETLHALGFWHEQSRTDRDDNVEIVWDVIQPGQEHNFNKYDESMIDLQGVPYDYASIMHYGSTAFSKNGSKTILALKPGAENMGTIDALSAIDLEELNLLYECKDIINGLTFTEWTEWSACDVNCKMERKRFCDGASCATFGEVETETSDCDVECEVGYDKDCGTKLHTEMAGVIHSPLYPYQYKSNAKCSQTIQVQTGGRVHLSFQAMEVEDYQGGCYYDFVHVYDGPDKNSPKIGTYCSTSMPETIISTDNSLTVLFTSDESVVQGGFLANYYATMAPVLVCHFENMKDYCGWTDSIDLELQFTSHKGGTGSEGTGPAVDHTSGTGMGRYIYLESSAPAVSGNRAGIVSPLLHPTSLSENFCFSMWYNMYGSNVGSIKVYLIVDGILITNPMISLSVNKENNDWYQATTTITATTSFQIEIQATRGNGYQGDIGIDDVTLVEGSC